MTSEAEQDHSESESSNLSTTESSKPQFSHASSVHVEHAGDIYPTADESLMEPEDQEHDRLDDYASGDMTPNAETQPDRSQEDNMEEILPLQNSNHQEPEPAERDIQDEMPVTPTRQSNTFDFALSASRHLVQEEHHNSLAESPATGDLFENSDEEEKNHLEVHGHGHDTSQEPTAQSLEHIRDSQRDGRKEEETHDATETRAFFASLVDTIRPDLSLLKRLANQESSSSHHQTDDNHSVSEYSLATPGEYFTPGTIEPAGPFQPQEPDTGLHTCTHTADTIPSFEWYAQSGGAHRRQLQALWSKIPMNSQTFDLRGKITVLYKVLTPLD
jgi:hypothetical protein